MPLSNFFTEHYSRINSSLRGYLRKKGWLSNIEIIQISSGFFAIAYSIIFFIYYALKVNLNIAFLFLIPILIGIGLIYSTKRGIMNEPTKQRRKETYLL